MPKRLFSAIQLHEITERNLEQPIEKVVQDFATVEKLKNAGVDTIKKLVIWSSDDLTKLISSGEVGIIGLALEKIGFRFGMRFVTLPAAW